MCFTVFTELTLLQAFQWLVSNYSHTRKWNVSICFCLSLALFHLTFLSPFSLRPPDFLSDSHSVFLYVSVSSCLSVFLSSCLTRYFPVSAFIWVFFVSFFNNLSVSRSCFLSFNVYLCLSICLSLHTHWGVSC